MARFINSCYFTPASSGTGSFVVSAAVQGFMTPAQAGAVNGGVYKYRAESADLSQWEVGEGTYTSGTTTLTRTTILQNSSGTTSAINFTAAPNVGIIAAKEDTLAIDEANSFTIAQQTQARSNINAALAPTILSNSLAADVSIPTIGTYVDGPSVAQGTTGTWLVTGTVTVIDSVGVAGFNAKLWDGTTVIASSSASTAGANFRESIALSGVITNPAANLKISVTDITSTSGKIIFNVTGNSKDSTLTAVRIG